MIATPQRRRVNGLRETPNAMARRRGLNNAPRRPLNLTRFYIVPIAARRLILRARAVRAMFNAGGATRRRLQF